MGRSCTSFGGSVMMDPMRGIDPREIMDGHFIIVYCAFQKPCIITTRTQTRTIGHYEVSWSSYYT